MGEKIRIEGIALYHPDKRLDNDYYIQHFKKQGKDVAHLLEDVFGRKERYVIDNRGKNPSEYENALTMQIAASKKVLKKCNLHGKDIDGIILVSQLNEYIAPPSSAFIHAAIHAPKHCFCYDLNMNCIGMIEAIQQASYYMKDKSKVKNILIVAGDNVNNILDKEDELLYGVFGESGCAIIVSNSGSESGIVEKECFIHNQVDEFIIAPKNGMSNVLNCEGKDFLSIQVGKGKFDLDIVVQKIFQMLKENHITLKQIKAFCFSQYSKQNIQRLCELLGISTERCPYIGDKYGYTLSSSPFVALESWIQEGKVKRGDYVLIWSVAVGIQHSIMLLRY